MPQADLGPAGAKARGLARADPSKQNPGRKRRHAGASMKEDVRGEKAVRPVRHQARRPTGSSNQKPPTHGAAWVRDWLSSRRSRRATTPRSQSLVRSEISAGAATCPRRAPPNAISRLRLCSCHRSPATSDQMRGHTLPVRRPSATGCSQKRPRGGAGRCGVEKRLGLYLVSNYGPTLKATQEGSRAR